jgi:hypothetical protein
MMKCRLAWFAAAIAASMAWVIVPTGASGRDWQDDQRVVVRATRLPATETAESQSQHFDEPVAGQWRPARWNRGMSPDYPRRFHRDDDELDVRIEQASRELASLEREADPGTANDAAIFSMDELTPFSFRLMGYVSIALALCGLVVVVRNRPTFGGLRGKNESRDARRTVVRCVVLLIVLNLADLGFTSLLVPTRSFVELNPLADTLLDSLPRLIVVKSVLIGGGTLLLLALWRHKIAQLASWGTAVTYVFAAMWWVMYFHAATS